MATCPSYRIRLFLSVDLVGSTAFKAESNKHDAFPHPDWLKKFQTFYSDFPKAVQERYAELSLKADNKVLCDKYPMVWKTVGDEIIFCNTVLSKRHLSRAVEAFLLALSEYGDKLEMDTDGQLDVKGAGWVSVYPTSNITLRIKGSNEEDISEELEKEADKDPRGFDFLGKHIDAGFRITKNASVDKFATSLELAYLLAEANLEKIFLRSFTYHGEEILKGVNKGHACPVITVDTERNAIKRSLRFRERTLSGRQSTDTHALIDYLKEFMKYHDIEAPCLPNHHGDAIESSASYEKFREAWQKKTNDNYQQDESIESSSEQNEQDNGDVNDTLSSEILDFEKNIISRKEKLDISTINTNKQE